MLKGVGVGIARIAALSKEEILMNCSSSLILLISIFK